MIEVILDRDNLSKVFSLCKSLDIEDEQATQIAKIADNVMYTVNQQEVRLRNAFKILGYKTKFVGARKKKV